MPSRTQRIFRYKTPNRRSDNGEIEYTAEIKFALYNFVADNNVDAPWMLFDIQRTKQAEDPIVICTNITIEDAKKLVMEMAAEISLSEEHKNFMQEIQEIIEI